VSKILGGFFLGGVIFSPAFTMALAYNYSQENRGGRVTFFVIQIPIVMLPYAMLLMTFVMAGPAAAMSQGVGLVAGHLYDFLTVLWPRFGGGAELIKTPTFIRRYLGGDGTGPVPTNRSYGTGFQPRATEPAGSRRGFTSGSSVLPPSWATRGSGQRLGSE
jgi:Derlin-2/3